MYLKKIQKKYRKKYYNKEKTKWEWTNKEEKIKNIKCQNLVNFYITYSIF